MSTSSQSQAIILDPTIAALIQEVQRLSDELSRLRADTEAWQERHALDNALLGKRVVALEHPDKEPGKAALQRAQKIIQYMNHRPDHRASFESLKGAIRANDVQLNQAVKALEHGWPGRFEARKDEHDGRKRWLYEMPQKSFSIK